MASSAQSNLLPQNSFLQIPSQDLLISCGAIPIDPTHRKIGIIRNPKNNTTFLPKGRKNIGEDLLSAALRETHEETGIPNVQPLPLKIPTRATPSSEEEVSEEEKESENPGVTRSLENCEPSSVTVFSANDNITRIIFWFAAAADSTAKLAEGTRESWEEGWVTEWVNARDAAGLLSYAGDTRAVEKVLQDMRDSGYEI